jgi:hypothetical protein
MRNLAGTGNGNGTILTGNAGNNVLNGGDRLDGGVGNDTVSYASATDSAFVLGIKALTTDQHLIYDAAKGALYYDADGSGSDPAVLLAPMANKAALAFGDIVVI